jgi:hypothetical protein
MEDITWPEMIPEIKQRKNNIKIFISFSNSD